jgi:hypothetical protein
MIHNFLALINAIGGWDRLTQKNLHGSEMFNLLVNRVYRGSRALEGTCGDTVLMKLGKKRHGISMIIIPWHQAC